VNFKPLVIIVGIVVLLALLVIGGISAASNYNQSVAVREAAQAARIASQGQTLSTMVSAILIVGVIVPLLGLSAFLAFRVISLQRKLAEFQAQLPEGQWVSGPNGNWRKVGAGSYAPRLADRPVTVGELEALFARLFDAPRAPRQLVDSTYTQRGSDFTDF